MAAAIILYGSRARGDARPGSDVDLIYAEDGDGFGSPTLAAGVSLHRYSQGWLLDRAREGDLFACHLAFEAIGLWDPSEFLNSLKREFKWKDNYDLDIEIGASVVKYLIGKDRIHSEEERRRYFWGLRTIVAGLAASKRQVAFSSSSAEKFCEVDGLAGHIDRRSGASAEECADFGIRVSNLVPQLRLERSSMLRERLLSFGGIASDTVRLVEVGGFEDFGSMPFYA